MILRLDVTDETSIAAAATAVSQRFGRCDLLINTSGVLHVPGELQPGAHARARCFGAPHATLTRGRVALAAPLCAETSLAAVTPDALMWTYRVNAMGARAPPILARSPAFG